MRLPRLIIVVLGLMPFGLVVFLNAFAFRPLHASTLEEQPTPASTNVMVQHQRLEPHGPVVVQMTDRPPLLSADEMQQLEKRRQRYSFKATPLPEGDPKARQANFTRALNQTKINRTSRQWTSQSPSSDPSLVVFQDASLQSILLTSYRSFISEPSAANRGSAIFETGNYFAALSTNGGNTFSFIDPQTAFITVTGGFCCDQVVTYDPTRDLMFWLLEYTDNSTQNNLRLAVFRGNDLNTGTSSIYYDFLSPTGTFYDFNDMCVSNNYLWLTTNTSPIASPGLNNGFMYRISLDQLKTGNTITATGFNSISNSLTNVAFRCTQGATTTMYWGSHNTRTQLRLFRWDENSSTPSWYNLNLTYGYNDGPYVCQGPDGRDWCGRFTSNLRDKILGAWVAKGIIGFMWDASPIGNYSRPYIEVARIYESTFQLKDQPAMQNNDFAVAYPAVAPNARGDLGIAIFSGGGQYYPTGELSIVDDMSPDPATQWLFQIVNESSQDPTANEWGDYLSVRPFSPNNLVWLGTTYFLDGCGGPVCLNPRFVVFGRERDRSSVTCYLPPTSCSSFLPFLVR